MARQNNPQRFFTNEFKIGDEVCIIRHEHGWEDGGVCGTIVEMSANHCVVRDDNGHTYHINHPRDISK